MVKISEFVKKIRSERNLTLEVLAKKASLSAGFLSRLEKGDFDKKNLSLSSLISLADGFDMKVKEFLDNLGLIENSDFPPMSVYLRQNGVDDPRDQKTIEDLINRLKTK
jgi:transcriptional regulator with XRE-family HTH domain